MNGQSRTQLTYRAVEGTRKGRVRGYHNDRLAIRLGSGSDIFERGKRGVDHWKMFQQDWINLCWHHHKVRVGTVVGVAALHFGLWSLNPCRVVYVVDEPGLFGFAYGTLADNVVSGEERFTVEWRPDDSVWYEIRSFSRPRHWLAWLAYPLTRLAQKRFARGSLKAMLEALVEQAQEPYSPFGSSQ